jgi:hypothetical protein
VFGCAGITRPPWPANPPTGRQRISPPIIPRPRRLSSKKPDPHPPTPATPGRGEVVVNRDREPCLPVWRDGRLEVVRWGNRRGESRRLPCTGWTWLATVEAGGWGEADAQPVVIPATLGLDRGVWFGIRQGVQGLAVTDERGVVRVFVLCEPASHYYRIMVRHEA